MQKALKLLMKISQVSKQFYVLRTDRRTERRIEHGMCMQHWHGTRVVFGSLSDSLEQWFAVGRRASDDCSTLTSILVSEKRVAAWQTTIEKVHGAAVLSPHARSRAFAM